MKLFKIFGAIMLLLLSACIAAAEPTGPSNLNQISSSRYPVTSASNISAIAGNVTELNIESNSITSTWQGYFGNISGSILLGDSNNNTMYDWTSASPTGEIFATRNVTTPTWSNIRCANGTHIDGEDAALGVTQITDQDSVNRTFLNTTAFNAFYVGNININITQNCFAVALHNSTNGPSDNFKEVLLYDGSSMIYTAIITQDSLGFDNRTHDFEMLVGEDGHNGNSATTPYYFYVELG
jgi:hypothetical protein